MSQYLFAYGTLQPGLAPREVAHLVAQMKLLGTGTISGALYDLGSYPGAIVDPASTRRITGTVFRLPADPKFLAALDEYEDCFPDNPSASLFVRRIHAVILSDDTLLHCWVYEYNRSVDRARVMESGVYGLE